MEENTIIDNTVTVITGPFACKDTFINVKMVVPIKSHRTLGLIRDSTDASTQAVEKDGQGTLHLNFAENLKVTLEGKNNLKFEAKVTNFLHLTE